MEEILRKVLKKGLIEGAKTECLVSLREAEIIGNAYIQGNRIHAKTNSLNSGFIVLYAEGKFAKLLK